MGLEMRATYRVKRLDFCLNTSYNNEKWFSFEDSLYFERLKTVIVANKGKAQKTNLTII